MRNKILKTIAIVITSFAFMIASIILASLFFQNGYAIAAFLLFVTTTLYVSNKKSADKKYNARRIFSEFCILIGLFLSIVFVNYEYGKKPVEEAVEFANAECKRQAQEKGIYFFHIHFKNTEKTKFECHFNEEQIGIINKSQRN